MRQVFADIDACAVYTNGFEGVVAVDITALAEYAEEEQAAFFLEGIEKVGRSATVILYTGAAPSRGLSSLVERFKSAARSVCDIRPGAYTPEELAHIAERQLDKDSVAVEGYEELHGALCDVMRARGCRTVKHAAAVVEEMCIRDRAGGAGGLARRAQSAVRAAAGRRRGAAAAGGLLCAGRRRGGRHRDALKGERALPLSLPAVFPFCAAPQTGADTSEVTRR